ncbi:MAG TPA: hypothetical protein VGD64_08780 [Acidisarcina sp.]
MASTSNRISPQVTEEVTEAGPTLVTAPSTLHPGEIRNRPNTGPAPLEWAWMAAIVALFLLHTIHLRADFPNFSPWMDYAKYTDEGWYGNAAIEAFIRGSWYVPGDFNTAVALPVWPFFEWLLFHFTGVSVAAARGLVVAVFGGNLWLTYAVVRASQHLQIETNDQITSGFRRDSVSESPRWPALLAATLVGASSFLYCFSRLAILEPLVTFFMLLSWLLVLQLSPTRSERPQRAKLYLRLMAIGVVLCLMIFTKTTAVVLLPSTFYLVWKACRDRIQAFAIVVASATLPGLAYYLLVVRPRFLEDFRYLFSANVYQQPTTPSGWLMAFWYSVHGGFWIGRTLFFIGAFFMLASLTPLLRLSRLWRSPLYVAAWLAVALQMFFIGYHNNMQPRYYTIAAFPLFILIALGVAHLLDQKSESGAPERSRVASATARVLGGLTLAAVLCAVVLGIGQTIRFVRHPEYTFVAAAEKLTRYIDEHPNGNRLLLSISGNQISLVTGIPSICDDFGTFELPLRLHKYQPGWYAAWNELDPGSLEDIHTQFLVEQVAKFRAFDDPDRNVLILYKLHPLPLAKQTLESKGDPDESAHVEPDFGGDDPH